MTIHGKQGRRQNAAARMMLEHHASLGAPLGHTGSHLVLRLHLKVRLDQRLPVLVVQDHRHLCRFVMRHALLDRLSCALLGRQRLRIRLAAVTRCTDWPGPGWASTSGWGNKRVEPASVQRMFDCRALSATVGRKTSGQTRFCAFAVLCVAPRQHCDDSGRPEDQHATHEMGPPAPTS